MANLRYVQWAILLLGVILCVSEAHGAAADLSSCPSALQKLLPCLSYVQGASQVPAASCCSSLLTIHTNTPQCLCELIAASINGTSGLPKMNTTLSLQLGPACNVKTQPSRCPGLLGIPAGSPEAKIFGNGATTNAPVTPGAGGNGAPHPPTPSGSHSLSSGCAAALITLAFAAFAMF